MISWKRTCQRISQKWARNVLHKIFTRRRIRFVSRFCCLFTPWILSSKRSEWCCNERFESCRWSCVCCNESFRRRVALQFFCDFWFVCCLVLGHILLFFSQRLAFRPHPLLHSYVRMPVDFVTGDDNLSGSHWEDWKSISLLVRFNASLTSSFLGSPLSFSSYSSASISSYASEETHSTHWIQYYSNAEVSYCALNRSIFNDFLRLTPEGTMPRWSKLDLLELGRERTA